MESVKKTIEKILKEKDFSVSAARALESAIALSAPEDERFEELLHILASYRPGGGEFLFGEKDLERECERVTKLI
jgi:hypothetical protein